METWYDQYWAQTWYQNTFLVMRPQQIGRTLANGPDGREWNNLYDCGCTFTCLAMIIGIDPAYLASALSSRRPAFFRADREYPARCLNGHRQGFVWDGSRPNMGQVLTITGVWHPKRACNTTIRITKIYETVTTNHDHAASVIAAAHAKGHHVIFGPVDHSNLVAGVNDQGAYFVWDPNAAERPVEDSLRGNITLEKIFDEYSNDQIDLWTYECSFTDAA